MSSKSLKNAAILLALEEIMLQTVVAVSLAVAFLTSNERGTHRQYNMLNQILAQVDPNARLMRFNTSPNGRATGGQGDDAQNEMSNQNDESNMRAEDEVGDGDENSSVCQPGSQRETRKTKGKKRKSNEEGTSTQLVELLSAFMQSTEAKLEQIAKCLGYEQDVVVKGNELFTQVDKIEGLSMMDKLRVLDELALCPHKLHLFQGLPETARKDYVQMLLPKSS